MNVVITGASSGIGRALALIFARHGHSVLAVARREELLLSLCREMVEWGAPVAAYLVQDLTSPGAAQKVFEAAMHDLGRVHVLINNAAMSPYQYFHDLHATHLHQILALNIQVLTELCVLFLPHMLAHGEPSRLVNVSSVGGYAPLPRLAVYSASKHYVRILTNILRREYRRSNIKVCGLYPGGTLTEFPELAGQGLRPFARRTMHTPGQVAGIAYPAILKGRRIIVPGFINQAGVLLGTLLPFPFSMRLTELIYDHNIEPVEPKYPL